MTGRRITAIVLLLVGAAATQWWLSSLQDDAEADRALPAARSDYTLEVFDLVVMNADGQPSFRIEAPYLEKHRQDEAVTLDQPVVQLFDQGRAQWLVESEGGWIRADGKELRLTGPVTLRQQDPQPDVVVQTRDLTVFPESRTAHSEQAVTLSKPGLYFTGVGLRAQLDHPRVEILSSVQGQYLPR